MENQENNNLFKTEMTSEFKTIDLTEHVDSDDHSSSQNKKSKYIKNMAKKKKTFKAKLELLNIPESINLKNIFYRLQ
jgi:hypothetical protein